MSEINTEYKQLVGKTINHYLIKRIIGSGSMGVVYLAYDKNLNRNVVIKVLKKEILNDDKTLLNRFKSEARNIAKLKHPNIIDVYSSNVFEDFHYIEMEYIVGNKLSDLIYKDKLSYQVAINLMFIICKAIQYLHVNKILHRDIKPSNIMITNSKELKIIDFGLSKNLKTIDKNGTHSNAMIGTPLYMSLECFDNALNATEKSDVYSLGVLFYELLTKQYPHNKSTYSELHKSLLANTPIRPKVHNNKINTEIDILIMNMIKKSPSSRIELDKVIQVLEKHIDFKLPCEYYDIDNINYNSIEYKKEKLLDMFRSTILKDVRQDSNISKNLYNDYLKNERKFVRYSIIGFMTISAIVLLLWGLYFFAII